MSMNVIARLVSVSSLVLVGAILSYSSPLFAQANLGVTFFDLEPLPSTNVKVISDYRLQPLLMSGQMTFSTVQLPTLDLYINSKKQSAYIVADDNQPGVAGFITSYALSSEYETLEMYAVARDVNGKSQQTEKYQVIVDQRWIRNNQQQRSRLYIWADGQSEVDITVQVFDNEGLALADRKLQVETYRGVDTLNVSSVITNSDGKATVTLTSSEEGTAVVAFIAPQKFVIAEIPVLVIPKEAATKVKEGVLKEGVSYGDLIKASQSTVYYVDSYGFRHPFIDSQSYNSWYFNTFHTLKIVSDEYLSEFPVGKPVPYRPGSIIKTPSVNEVYFVDVKSQLRHIVSEQVAYDLYGPDWAEQVQDIQESLLFSYTIGDPVRAADDVNRELIPYRYDDFRGRLRLSATPNGMLLGY